MAFSCLFAALPVHSFLGVLVFRLLLLLPALSFSESPGRVLYITQAATTTLDARLASPMVTLPGKDLAV